MKPTEALLLKNEIIQKIDNIYYPRPSRVKDSKNFKKSKNKADKEYKMLQNKLNKVQRIIDKRIYEL
jgi:hypothetical protein